MIYIFKTVQYILTIYIVKEPSWMASELEEVWSHSQKLNVYRLKSLFTSVQWFRSIAADMFNVPQSWLSKHSLWHLLISLHLETYEIYVQHNKTDWNVWPSCLVQRVIKTAYYPQIVSPHHQHHQSSFLFQRLTSSPIVSSYSDKSGQFWRLRYAALPWEEGISLAKVEM